MPESGVTTDGQADRVPETRTERTRRHPTVRSLYQRNGEKPAATGEAKTDGDEPTTESDGSTPDDASFSTDADETFADGQQPADAKAAMDVEISTEQKTEIRTVFHEVEVERVDVDIDIDVGGTVPQAVVLHPLPPRIVEIVPVSEGYVFFILADATIVIVIRTRMTSCV